jgi:hypothetical protein
MRLGTLHLSGPQAWPDHLLSYETGDLLVGTVIQIGSCALGFELHRGSLGSPSLAVYLGPWAFEAYWDRAHQLEEYDL